LCLFLDFKPLNRPRQKIGVEFSPLFAGPGNRSFFGSAAGCIGWFHPAVRCERSALLLLSVGVEDVHTRRTRETILSGFAEGYPPKNR